MRGIFIVKNLDFLKDVMYLYSFGIKEILIEFVVLDKSSFWVICESYIERIKEEYDILVEEFINVKFKGEGFNFFYFNIDFIGGLCVLKRFLGCGVGFEYVVVDFEGNIFLCY